LRSAVSFIMPLFKEHFRVLQDNSLLTSKMEQDFTAASTLVEDLSDLSSLPDSPAPSPYRPTHNNNSNNNSRPHTSHTTTPTRSTTPKTPRGLHNYPKTPTFQYPAEPYEQELQRQTPNSSRRRQQHQIQHHNPQHHQQHHYHHQIQQLNSQQQTLTQQQMVQPSPGTAIDQGLSKVNMILATKKSVENNNPPSQSSGFHVAGKQLKPSISLKDHPYMPSRPQQQQQQQQQPHQQFNINHINPTLKYTRMVGRVLELPPITSSKGGDGGRDKDKENILLKSGSSMLNQKKITRPVPEMRGVGVGVGGVREKGWK